PVAQSSQAFHSGCSDTLNVFPSGSLNHATFDPVGVVQMPNSSCFMNPYRSKVTPACCSFVTIEAISETCQPSTVPGNDGTSFPIPKRSIVPFALNTSANGGSSLTSRRPSVSP